MKWLVVVCSAVAMVANTAVPMAGAADPEVISRGAGEHVILFDKPASDWMKEALPLGNGRLGCMVFGGVGNLWGTLVGAFSLGVFNKFLEPWSGAVLAKIFVLVLIILFIQKRPRGLFPQKGRAVES